VQIKLHCIPDMTTSTATYFILFSCCQNYEDGYRFIVSVWKWWQQM